jgi:hypothetical protein
MRGRLRDGYGLVSAQALPIRSSTIADIAGACQLWAVKHANFLAMPASKTTKRVTALIFLGLCVEPLFHRGALIDHVRLAWRVIGVSTGIILSMIMAILIIGAGVPDRRIRETLAVLGAMVLGGVIGSHYVRAATELVAFTWRDARYSRMEAQVFGISRGKWGHYYADVLPEEGARQLHVSISSRLFERLEPRREPDEECLRLYVQTGRNGVRRTTLPNYFDQPLDSNRLGPCARQPS